MFNADFQDVIWHRDGVIFPTNQKVFRLRYLQIAPLGTDTEDSSRLYALTHIRTGEVLCHLRVCPEDVNDFKSFQNVLLSSKLGI